MRQRGGQTTTKNFSSILPFLDESTILTKLPSLIQFDVLMPWTTADSWVFYNDESYFGKTYMQRYMNIINFSRTGVMFSINMADLPTIFAARLLGGTTKTQILGQYERIVAEADKRINDLKTSTTELVKFILQIPWDSRDPNSLPGPSETEFLNNPANSKIFDNFISYDITNSLQANDGLFSITNKPRVSPMPDLSQVAALISTFENKINAISKVLLDVFINNYIDITFTLLTSKGSPEAQYYARYVIDFVDKYWKALKGVFQEIMTMPLPGEVVTTTAATKPSTTTAMTTKANTTKSPVTTTKSPVTTSKLTAAQQSLMDSAKKAVDDAIAAQVLAQTGVNNSQIALMGAKATGKKADIDAAKKVVDTAIKNNTAKAQALDKANDRYKLAIAP